MSKRLERTFMRFGAHVVLAFATAGVIAACGGGSTESQTGTGGSTGSQTGTLRLSLTDAPACGFDHAWVTVEKVRVHRSGSASDGDPGWSEVLLPTPMRVDLLELNNGTLLPLGQTELPAGTYTQMRLVLSDNAGTNPPANAVQVEGSNDVTPLTTPSGQQSGLKMNVNVEVPAGKVADFAIDFDGCKSFVRAGNSGKILLKPVLAVIPLLSEAGQRIVGWVDPAIAFSTTSVSAQVEGVPVRATPPDPTGKFTLYPVPLSSTGVNLVVTAPGRVNAVMTGVPVSDTTTTVIGNINVRFDPTPSDNSYDAYGTVEVGGNVENTNGVVRALQSHTDGTVFEAGVANANATTGKYLMTLPAGAPVFASYAANLTAIAFTTDTTRAGLYTLEAKVPTVVPMTKDIPLNDADFEWNFVFP
jgi:hypothetical protein